MNFSENEFSHSVGMEMKVDDYGFNQFGDFPSNFSNNRTYQGDTVNNNISNNNVKSGNFLMPASSSSNSDYSSNSYGTPSSVDTPSHPSNEYFQHLQNPSQPQAAPQPQAVIDIPSNGPLSPSYTQQYSQQQEFSMCQMQPNVKAVQANPYFTPATGLHVRSFHERNKSEISELNSPSMHNTSIFDESASSPVRNNTNARQTIDPLKLDGSGNFDEFVNVNHQQNHSGYYDFLRQVPENEDVANFQLPSDIANYLDLTDFVSLNGKDAEDKNISSTTKNQTASSKIKDYSKVDLSSLGIGIKPSATSSRKQEGEFGDISFSINESFINEILNEGPENGTDTEIGKDLLKEIGNEFNDPSILLPAFQGESQNKQDNFFNPNNLSSLRQINSLRQHGGNYEGQGKPSVNTRLMNSANKAYENNPFQDLDEGDTTIMNSTSMMEMNENVHENNGIGSTPNTDNLIDEIKGSETRDRKLYTPTHSRNNSVNKFEMPKLKSFSHKSPKLGSPSRIGKFSHSTSFKSIPALNEKLTFIDESQATIVTSDNLNSPLRGGFVSPTHNNFDYSLPGSPTRDNSMYLTKTGDNSFVVKPIPNGLTSPIHGGPHLPMYYSNYQGFPDQTPPASPSKAMSGLSLLSPTKGSPGKKPSMTAKGPFMLKPTPNARKRVATSPRSKTGCWTCRIRHKKCDEGRPICNNCAKIDLKCDQFYDPKPTYVSDKEERQRKLAEIAHIWKTRSKKGGNRPNAADRLLSKTNRGNSESPSPQKKAVSEMANNQSVDKENISA